MDLVLGNISDAVYVTDQNGYLIFVNQFFALRLNVPTVYLLGQELDKVYKCSLKEDLQNEFLLKKDTAEASNDTKEAIYEWVKDKR